MPGVPDRLASCPPLRSPEVGSDRNGTPLRGYLSFVYAQGSVYCRRTWKAALSAGGKAGASAPPSTGEDRFAQDDRRGRHNPVPLLSAPCDQFGEKAHCSGGHLTQRQPLW